MNPNKAKEYVIKWIRLGMPIEAAIAKIGITRSEIDQVCEEDELETAQAQSVTNLLESIYLGSIETPKLAMEYLDKMHNDVMTSTTGDHDSVIWHNMITLGVRGDE